MKMNFMWNLFLCEWFCVENCLDVEGNGNWEMVY